MSESTKKKKVQRHGILGPSVLDVLLKKQRPMHITEVSDLLPQFNHQQVRDCLARLARMNIVQKAGRGWYVYYEDAPEAVVEQQHSDAQLAELRYKLDHPQDPVELLPVTEPIESDFGVLSQGIDLMPELSDSLDQGDIENDVSIMIDLAFPYLIKPHRAPRVADWFKLTAELLMDLRQDAQSN